MPARIEEETLPNLNWEEWRFCGDGKMYKVFKSRLTFDEAAEECSEIGGRLGHIKTAREFNCVKEAFEPFNSWNTYWIGLKSTDGSLKWEDGSDYKKCAGCEPGWEYLDAKTAASEEKRAMRHTAKVRKMSDSTGCSRLAPPNTTIFAR